MSVQESLEADSLPTPPFPLEKCPADDAVQDSVSQPFPVVEVDDSMDFISRAFYEARLVAEKALGKNTKISKKKRNASKAKMKKVKKEIQKVSKEATKDKEPCWWSWFEGYQVPFAAVLRRRPERQQNNEQKKICFESLPQGRQMRWPCGRQSSA